MSPDLPLSTLPSSSPSLDPSTLLSLLNSIQSKSDSFLSGYHFDRLIASVIVDYVTPHPCFLVGHIDHSEHDPNHSSTWTRSIQPFDDCATLLTHLDSLRTLAHSHHSTVCPLTECTALPCLPLVKDSAGDVHERACEASQELIRRQYTAVHRYQRLHRRFTAVIEGQPLTLLPHTTNQKRRDDAADLQPPFFVYSTSSASPHPLTRLSSLSSLHSYLLTLCSASSSLGVTELCQLVLRECEGLWIVQRARRLDVVEVKDGREVRQIFDATDTGGWRVDWDGRM